MSETTNNTSCVLQVGDVFYINKGEEVCAPIPARFMDHDDSFDNHDLMIGRFLVGELLHTAKCPSLTYDTSIFVSVHYPIFYKEGESYAILAEKLNSTEKITCYKNGSFMWLTRE